MKKIIPVLFLIFFVIKINAQYNEYYPEYEWLTIENEHAAVHYHPGAERSAKVVLKIIGDVWEPITTLYQYEPDKVHFVIKDIDDYSNGATYFFDNKIEIWASALDFDLRGTHNWLRNVISHEFTHMVQIQSAMKVGRTAPALYLQVLSYEDEYRPDILYGYPNVIVSYPLATLNMPAWFAEGTAQYMRREFNYDNWDTHRDMILRSYAIDDNMLSWNQMGVFSKTSLGNESVYNSGFALTRYISQRYGEDKLRTISHHLGDFTNFTIDAAFKDVLGKDGDELYDEWSGIVKNGYHERLKDVLSNVVAGDTVAQEGFGNFYPAFSEDGKKIYYVSNKSEDYFGLSAIYEYDIDSKSEKSIESGVRSTVSPIPGADRIVYAKISPDNPNWTKIHDLYYYDIKADEEKRLTFGLRANSPSVSHDAKKIVFVYQKDGTTNLGIVDIDGKNFKRLSFYSNGEQVYNPRFAPDDSYIIFDYSYANTRDIARVDTSGANLEFVIQTAHDDRNPFITKENVLYYSSDETGIYNIYSIDLNSNEKRQLTNVTGGAFMPAVDENGNIAYAGYISTGYKIFLISKKEQDRVDPSHKYNWQNDPPLGKWKPNGDMTSEMADRFRNYDDYKIPDFKSEKYTGFFSRMTFFPFIRFDNYKTTEKGLEKIKPGIYFTSSDMLNRFSVFGGGAVNARMERDLFLMFEYRDKLPLLFNLGLKPELKFELFSVSRKTNVDLVFDPLDPSYDANTSVTYSLFEVDFAAKHKIISPDHYLELRFIWSSYAAILGSFIIPGSTTLYPTTSDTYFVGRNFQATYNYTHYHPTRDMEINPVGRRVNLRYNYEWNKFNKDNQYEVKDGLLKPVYGKFNYHKLEVNWWESYELWKDHTLTGHFRAATIFGPPVPDFFDFYLGGLVGMRGYPFYAVSGNELGWLNLTYRFPLFRNIDARFGSFYLDKIFFSVFGDYGHSWTGNNPAIKDFKKGAGAEIRMKFISFYLFPTSLFFSAAYAFDPFERTVRDETVYYGKKWRFYGGILFDFNLYSENNNRRLR